jgi:hypothetical protein
MPMSPAENHPVCPKCSGEGQAHSVMYKARLRTVSYACEHCDHEWEIITSDITSDGARLDPDGPSVQPVHSRE